MQKYNVDSSMINEIGYDELRAELEITFKNGDTWRYSNFPEHLWDGFQASSSKGKYFHAKIKEQFTPFGRKV